MGPLKSASNAVPKHGDLVVFLGFAALDIAYGRRGLRWNMGMAIAATGFLLWATARVQLGESFSVTAQAKALVTAGLYSKIRHPVYLFGGLGYLGLFIAWGSWWLTIAFAVLQALQIRRIRKEEKVLEEAFGKEYRSYKRQTWF